MEESCLKVSKELLNGLSSIELNQNSKLSHLNSFVIHLNHHFFSICSHLKQNTVLHRIIMCLKQCCLKDSLIIRIAVLRCLRYLCIDSFVISLLFKLNMHHLIIRSLDTPYESEKLQALRLIRTIILPYKNHPNYTSSKSHNIGSLSSERYEAFNVELNEVIPLNYIEALLRPIVAIVNKGDTKKNKMFNVCLCTLCEAVLKDADLVEKIGGLRALFWKPSTHPFIYNIIIITIVHLLNQPSSFKYYKYLQKLVSSFTDFKSDVQPEENEPQEQNFSKQSIIRMLKTWCGFYHLCYPPQPPSHQNQLDHYTLSAVELKKSINKIELKTDALYTLIQNSTSLHFEGRPVTEPHQNCLLSLLDALPLSSITVQSDILDIFYGWFNIQTPPNYKRFRDVTIKQLTASKPERWGLLDSFIAAEACDLLPSRNKFSISRFHRSLHLKCLLQLNFQEVLVQLIMEADITIAIKACILLAHWSSLCYYHLPHKDTTNHLSSLVQGLCHSHDALQRMRCREALKLVSRIQDNSAKNMICTASPFLRQQYHFYNNLSYQKHNLFHSLSFDSFTLASTSHYSDKETLTEAVRRSRVLYSNSYKDWQWKVVLYILKLKNQVWERVELAERFLFRLTEAFKPSAQCYSATTLTSDEAVTLTSVLLLLIQLFITSSLKFSFEYFHKKIDQLQFAKALFASFLKDINTNLKTSLDGAGVFQSSSLLSYCSVNYFLILGCLSSDQETNQLLADNLIYKHMAMVISSASSNETLSKLIISSFDYSSSSHAKSILTSAFSSSSKTALLYCTDFVRLLLRCNGCKDWMLELLFSLINHRSSTVSSGVVSVLVEASNHEEHMASISKLVTVDGKEERKEFEWHCLMARVAAASNSLHLSQLALLWHHHLNYEYVEKVEEKLLKDNIKNNPFSFQSTDLPIHLLGELSKSDRGLEMMFGGAHDTTLCKEATEERRTMIGDQTSCVLPVDLVQVHLDAVGSYVRTLNLSEDDKKDKVLEHLKIDIQTVKKTASSLWALGHIGSTEKGLGKLLQRQECLVKGLISMACGAWPLSLRGTAFCVLNMISSVEKGREILQQYGWVCYASISCCGCYEENVQFDGEIAGEKICMQDSHAKSTTNSSKKSSSVPSNYDLQSQTEAQQKRIPVTSEDHNDKTNTDVAYTSITREAKAHYSTSPLKSSLLPPTSLLYTPSKNDHKKKPSYKMFKNFLKKIKPKTMFQPNVSPYSNPSRSIDTTSSKAFKQKNDHPSGPHTNNKHSSFTPSSTSITTSVSSLSVTPSYYPPSFPDELVVNSVISDSVSPFYSLTSLRRSKKGQRNKNTLSLDYRSSDVASKTGLKEKIKSIRFKVVKRDLMKQVKNNDSFLAPFNLSSCATQYVCLPKQLSSLFQNFNLEKTSSPSDPAYFSQQEGAYLFEFSHKHQVSSCIRCATKQSVCLRNDNDDEDYNNEDNENNNSENNTNDNESNKNRNEKNRINDNNKRNNSDNTIENDNNKKNSNNDESDKMGDEMRENRKVEVSRDVWKEVVSLVMHLSSTVPSRSCQQALYSIKEKNPEYFKDECLYSDVSELLSSGFFSVEARAFTQSLFEF